MIFDHATSTTMTTAGQTHRLNAPASTWHPADHQPSPGVQANFTLRGRGVHPGAPVPLTSNSPPTVLMADLGLHVLSRPETSGCSYPVKFSLVGTRAHIRSAMGDGEDDTLVPEQCHCPSRRVSADAVGLDERAFGRHPIEVLKLAVLDHPAHEARELAVQGSGTRQSREVGL